MNYQPIRPKISVIMPCYNSAPYVSEAIESILNQTYRDFEFIIIDDGSNDNTPEILAGYKDSRIKIVRKEKNEGLIPALNLGIKLASGEYLARMDADDIALPQRFEREIDFLDSHPDFAVVGTRAWRIDGNGKVLEPMIFITHWKDVHYALEHGICPIIHSSVLMRTSVVRSLGGYRDQFKHAEDFDLWLRIIEAWKICNLREKLMLYRSNPKGVRLTKSIEASLSSAYALNCYLRRKARLKEVPFYEFFNNANIHSFELTGKRGVLSELLLLGELDQLMTILTSLNDRRSRILAAMIQTFLGPLIATLYRKYRRVRGWIGDTPFGGLVGSLRLRLKFSHFRQFVDSASMYI
ncbi:MAG: glycosyltransferase [Candidatus Methanomethyliaceae archaeon]